MVNVTGFVPKIVYDNIPHFEGLYPKGDNIDITITDEGTETRLAAITLGNGTWDIDELDDNLNLFPQYGEGDMISLDVLKKTFMKYDNLNQSTNILSFNALGKMKYGIKDTVRKVNDKLSWFTDDLNEEDALNFIRKHYPGAKMYRFDLYKKQDGKIYKTLFSSEGRYYVLCVLRNGNDIRFVDDDDYDDTPIFSTANVKEALELYNNYPEESNIIDDPEDADIEHDFTRDELVEALQEQNSFDLCELIDFEPITDEKYTYDGLPTAIGMCAATDNNYLYAGWVKFFADDDDEVHLYDGGFTQIPDEQSVDQKVQQVLKEYRLQGGKKTQFGNIKKEFDDLNQSLKKKKSKYNGKNVTGYENGMTPVASAYYNKDNAPTINYNGFLFYAQTIGYVSSVIKGVKTNSSKYVNEIAEFLAPQLTESCILIPTPQHSGKAIYTLEICNKIKDLRPDLNIDVCDVLSQNPREEELRNIKKTASKEDIDSMDLGMSISDIKLENKPKYLVDNTISTGMTFDAVKRLIPDIQPLVFSMSRKFLESHN